MSPQPCTICADERRPEIDEALVAGEPGRSVSRRFDLAEASVRRHRQNHVSGDAPVGTVVPTADQEPDLRTAARERLQREKAEAEEARLSRYEEEEAARLEEERLQARRERERQEAQVRAEELRAQLRHLSQQAEEDLAQTARTLAEYASVRQKLQRELSAAGERSNTDPTPWMTQRFVGDRLGEHAPGGHKNYAYSGQSLSEQDPLVPSRGE